MTALLRAHRVLRELGLGDNGQLERAPSVANEVWFLGASVLRVSATRGTRRLEYEAAVARALLAGALIASLWNFFTTASWTWGARPPKP